MVTRAASSPSESAPVAAAGASDAQQLAQQDELTRVLQSAAFAGATAHQRLLAYLAEHSLAGRVNMLKETLIAIEVFQRPAERYDPRRDSIVRVEARRLRARLAQHYESADPAGGLRLELPKGSYRLQWREVPADAAGLLAQELVERGLYFLRQGHEDGHRKALARFEEAAAAAPALAAAHSGVARAWLQLVATNIEPPLPGVDRALAAVRRALDLQPAQADAQVLAAQLTHRFAYDWPGAQAHFLRAARVAPESAYVHHAHALSLMMRAQFEAAEAELGRARQLDPLHLSLRAHQALLHLYRRQWPAAVASLRALLDLSPDNVLGLSLLAYVALCQGEPAAALAQYREVQRLHPALSIGLAGQVQALAALGEGGAARAALQDLQQQAPGRYLSPYQLAMAELRLAQPGQALHRLQRAVDERDPNAWCLRVDPAFDSLHGLPAFRNLVQQVHGPEVLQALD